MSKQTILLDESSFQSVCSKFVERNVIYCVSSLMYDIGQNLDRSSEIFGFDYDEAMGWFQRPDYETAIEEFIRRNADFDELEQAADMSSYWADVCEQAGVPISTWESVKSQLEDRIAEYDDKVGEAEDAEDEDSAAQYEHLRDGCQAMLDKIDDFEDWVKQEDKEEDLREIILDNLKSEPPEEVASEFNIDPEYDEVYEHWIVDRYFAGQLRKYGELVFEFGGMTIWGRCTTGQSISIDGVIRKMVRNLDDDHYLWSEK